MTGTPVWDHAITDGTLMLVQACQHKYIQAIDITQDTEKKIIKFAQAEDFFQGEFLTHSFGVVHVCCRTGRFRDVLGNISPAYWMDTDCLRRTVVDVDKDSNLRKISILYNEQFLFQPRAAQVEDCQGTYILVIYHQQILNVRIFD